MRYRDLGRTGLVVSEIGFGAWGIGSWQPGQLSYGVTDDEVSLAALDRALNLGITFIDTSNLYGMGHSERLVGRAIAGRREAVVLATKVGHVDHHVMDHSPAALERSLEDSLGRLGTDHVDLLQLHGATPDILRADPGIIGCLERMRSAGTIRAWGMSANTPADAAQAVREFGVPVVQVNLNMLDARAWESGLLDLARDHGTGLIARTPLAFGFLAADFAEDTVFPPEDHRSRYSGPRVAAWVRQARAAREAVSAEMGAEASLVQNALRFCLAVPEVSVVIPGILTPREAEENSAASDLGPLPASLVDRIAQRSLEEDRKARPS